MKTWQDWSGRILFAIALLTVWIAFPWDTWISTLPAAGGDTGSHFGPLYAMIHSGSIRPWNPGNLMGEPILVHYFPFPFLVMRLLSFIIPAGMAFNWVTALSVPFFMAAVFTGLLLMEFSILDAGVASIFALLMTFNGAYSAWGGNIFSTLSGQFSHEYALGFLFLLQGIFDYELRTQKKGILTGIVGICTILSHAYAAMAIPFVMVPVYLFHRKSISIKGIFIFMVRVGLIWAAGSVWWILPMLENSAWTTPYASAWLTNTAWSVIFPKIFYFPLAIGLVSLVVNIIVKNKDNFKRHLLWWLPAVFYWHMCLLFPSIGLVDIRAIPQIYFFLLLSLAVFFSRWISSQSKPWMIAVLTGLIMCSGFLIYPHFKTARAWASWNYAGWEPKELNASRKKLMAHLSGSFSDPRIIFEQNDENNKAGTIRLFENLPWMADRATTESLYMQATVAAPMAYYLQSTISLHPSCPFPNLPCGHVNFVETAEKMPLAGARDLILVSTSVAQMAEATHLYEKVAEIKPWLHYRLKKPVSLVEVLSQAPDIRSAPDWKGAFLEWFMGYPKSGRPFIPYELITDAGREQISNLEVDDVVNEVYDYSPTSCSASVEAMYNQLTLKTSCPGRFHVLKFAFHPSFRSLTGETLFPVSPGYIGIIPRSNEVTLNFGQDTAWKLSPWISLGALLMVLLWLGAETLLFKSKIKKNP